MNDHRLPDEDLTVLVERAAEAIATNGGHDWANLHGISKNAFREKCLPIIFHSTKALHDLGYRKPRTITTAEELNELPDNSVIRTAGTDEYEPRVVVKLSNWNGSAEWDVADCEELSVMTCELDDLPATVLWEPK